MPDFKLETGFIIAVVLALILFFISWTLDAFSKECLIQDGEDRCTLGDNKQKTLLKVSSWIMVASVIVLSSSLIVFICDCNGLVDNITKPGNQFGKSFGNSFGNSFGRSFDEMSSNGASSIGSIVSGFSDLSD